MPAIPLPKADCHVHANGMATDRDVLRLAHIYNVDLSTFTRIGPDGRRDWAGDHHSASHDAYDQTVSLVREPGDLRLIVENGLRLRSEQGCLYTRLLSSGMNNCRVDSEKIERFERNMLGIIMGIKNARAISDAQAFLSISAKRHLKNAPHEAHRLLDAYEAFKKKHPDEAVFITGFDIAGNEEKANLAEFKDVFARVQSLGLGGSCHAGEVQGPEDIWNALELPGVTQISHALNAIHDPALMKALKEREILVDQLLVSNDILHDVAGGNRHPITAYVREGLRIGLGSDDPGIQRSTIADEYDRAQSYGLTPEQLLECTANSIRFGFAPASIREELLNKVAASARELEIPLRPEFLTLPKGRRYEAQPVA